LLKWSVQHRVRGFAVSSPFEPEVDVVGLRRRRRRR